MRICSRWIAIIVCFNLLIACGSDDRPSEWKMPFTESFAIHSSATQHDYEIMVALPRDYSETQARHPVLYVLDANGIFPIAVETLRFLQFDPLKQDPVIIGIGYPVGLYWNTLGARFRDFTPTPDPEFVRQLAGQYGFSPEGSGGAAAFLDFFAKEIIPVVERRYRIASDSRALYGYSMGGLFAFYALFQQPGLFQKYLIGAPGLWWDQGAGWKIEQDFSQAHKELSAQIFLTVGSLDEKHVSVVKKLDELFRSRKYSGLTCYTQFFESETHNSVIPLTLSRGIRWLYADMAKGF